MKGKTIWIAVAVATVSVLLTLPLSSALFNIATETAIHGNTITVTYYSSSPVVVDPSTPDYEVSEGTVTYGGTDYDAINIANDDNPNGAVADSNGNVDVTVNLNDDRPFCFEIRHYNGENSKLHIVITENGTVIRDVTSNISGNVSHYIGATGKYFGMTAMNNSNDWFQSNTVLNVQITNYAGHVPDNVTLKIIFKPTS